MIFSSGTKKSNTVTAKCYFSKENQRKPKENQWFSAPELKKAIQSQQNAIFLTKTKENIRKTNDFQFRKVEKPKKV